MTTIKLHGILEKEFGKEFNLEISKAKEVIMAIDANKKGFLHRVLELSRSGFNYAIMVNGENIKNINQIKKEDIKKIDLVPVIIGQAGIGALIVALAPVITPAIFPTLAAGAGLTLATIGVAVVGLAIQYALNPTPDVDLPVNEQVTRALDKSFSFSNKANIATQGTPVPIGYGRLKVGSYTAQFSASTFPQYKTAKQVLTRGFKEGDMEFSQISNLT